MAANFSKHIQRLKELGAQCDEVFMEHFDQTQKAQKMATGGRVRAEDVGRQAAKLGIQVGIARGEVPGRSPLKSLSTAELAELDRLAQGAVFAASLPRGLRLLAPLVGGVGASLNELSKAVPGAQNAIADILGEEQFRVGPSTSKPSIKNVKAFLEGVGAVPQFKRGGKVFDQMKDYLRGLLSLALLRGSRFEDPGAGFGPPRG